MRRQDRWLDHGVKYCTKPVFEKCFYLFKIRRIKQPQVILQKSNAMRIISGAIDVGAIVMGRRYPRCVDRNNERGTNWNKRLVVWLLV